MQNNQTRFGLKSQIREALFKAYIEGNIDKESIISRLEISPRQFYRLQNKFVATGNLAHGLCNQISNKSIDNTIKDNVLSLCQSTYKGFNYEHASELLHEHNQIKISASTLRKWLLKANITQAKRRKPKKYMRRTPKAGFNDMLQLDGTFYEI